MYERLRDAWLKEGSRVNAGSPLEAIENLERNHGVKLPTEFRTYLAQVGGMVEGVTDEQLIAFLSIDEVEQELKAKHDDPTVIEITFAEFSIYAHYYFLRATNVGDELGVYAADGTNEKKLASSFREFIEAYLTDAERVANCW
jgi:hypothetical protein